MIKSVIDKIYRQFVKDFAMQAKRFPTPQESDELLDNVEEVIRSAVNNNRAKAAEDMSYEDVVKQTLSQDVQSILNDAADAPVVVKAQIEALPLKDPKLRLEALKNKMEADNMMSRDNLQKSAAKSKLKAKKDKETMEDLADKDQIPVRDDTDREDFAVGGKAILDKIRRQMKSPFGRMAMKESSGALPKGVEEGSAMGDILTGVAQLENLLSEGKSLPYTRMEIADFVVNMRRDGFSNEAIKEIVGEYGQSYRLKTLREKIAPQIQLADQAGAKTRGGRKFVVDLEDTKDNYSPSEFREYIAEKDYVFELEDAIKSDLIDKGLSDEAAENLSSMIYRYKDENIFDAFEKMKREASFEYDIDIDDIADSYSEIVGKYVLPQQKQYRKKFAKGGKADGLDYLLGF